MAAMTDRFWREADLRRRMPLAVGSPGSATSPRGVAAEMSRTEALYGGDGRSLTTSPQGLMPSISNAPPPRSQRKHAPTSR
jgi:hypothetical protein